jgi:hypothetical protein
VRAGLEEGGHGKWGGCGGDGVRTPKFARRERPLTELVFLTVFPIFLMVFWDKRIMVFAVVFVV